MTAPRSIMWPWFAVGALALCWSLYELWAAVASAAGAGTIAVSPYARGEPRHIVGWPRASAFLIGLGLVFWSGLSAISEALGFNHRALLPSLLLLPCGFILVLFSAYLSSLGGISYLACFCAGMAILFAVQRRFGKWAAVAAWGIVVACAIYWGYAV